LRWISSCFPQDLHSWEQLKKCCSQYRWGSARVRTKLQYLKTVRIQNLWYSFVVWILFRMVCNFIKLYYWRLIHSEDWILLSTHAIVRRKFDQLFTRAAGNGVLVRNSNRTIKGIGNVLINLKLRFFRLSVVVKTMCVKISDCLFVGFLILETKFRAPYYISSCDLSPSAVSLKLQQIRLYAEKH